MPYVSNEGAEIFWRESGSGEPLLLIMGLGYPCEMWHHVESMLAEHYRVILFDNRGIAHSPVVPGPHHIATMASDAAAVLSAAGEETAFIFGISMGGYIAQEFALNYPDRVRSLILGCTGCAGDKAIPASDAVLEVLMARAHMEPADGIRAMMPYIYDKSTPQDRLDADFEIRMRTYPAPETYLAQLDGISAWTSWDRLPQISSRTQIIHGETDELVPPGNARILAERIPNARLRMLPQASHIFFTDQPDETVSIVRDFLMRCPTRRQA